MNFLKFSIGVESALDKLHFICRTQSQKIINFIAKIHIKSKKQEMAKIHCNGSPWIIHLLL